MDRRELIQRHPHSTNLQKRIYLYMLEFEDDEGLIRVKQKDIAESLGVSQPSVNRALRSLPWLVKNCVIWAAHERCPERGRGNVYWFMNEFAKTPKNKDRTHLYTDYKNFLYEPSENDYRKVG